MQSQRLAGANARPAFQGYAGCGCAPSALAGFLSAVIKGGAIEVGFPKGWLFQLNQVLYFAMRIPQ